MSSRYLIPLAVAAALAAPVAAHAQDEGTYDPGKWLVRVGLSQINPDKENLEIPGAAFLVVDSDVTPTGTVESSSTSRRSLGARNASVTVRGWSSSPPSPPITW
mgnify:CR=1 FL=1